MYLDANAKIKVRSSENAWYGNETTWQGCGFTLDADHNVCIIESAAYNISFYLNSAEGNHIVIGKATPPEHIEINPSSFHGLVVTDHGDYYTLAFGSESFDVEKGAAPKSTFTFTINYKDAGSTTQYQAEEGMTWADFIASSYNTNNDVRADMCYKNAGACIYSDSATYVLCSAEDTLIADHIYYATTGGN